MDKPLTLNLPLETYVSLDYNESVVGKELKYEPAVHVSMYVGQEDTPTLEENRTLKELLKEMIATHSIPSNPLTTKPEYRENLLKILDSFDSVLKEARQEVLKMKDHSSVVKEKEKPKAKKAKMK